MDTGAEQPAQLHPATPPVPAAASDDELLRLFLQTRAARCPGCGYDLRSAPSSRCPECGMKLELGLSTGIRPHIGIIAALAFGAMVIVGLLQAGTSLYYAITYGGFAAGGASSTWWVYGFYGVCEVLIGAWGMVLVIGGRRSRHGAPAVLGKAVFWFAVHLMLSLAVFGVMWLIRFMS